MKKLFHVLLLYSLLACNSYNFSIQDDDIEADNNIISSEILYALEILSPVNNETVEQRYTNLINAYNESPYSIITSSLPGIHQINQLEYQAQKELLHIKHAYQIMQKYNLTNKTSTEIESMLAPFLQTKEPTLQLSEEKALHTLGLLTDSPWTDIAGQFYDLQREYELNDESGIDDELFEEMLKAYNFLQELHEKKKTLK